VSSVVYGMKNEIREDANLRRRVERIEWQLQMNDLTPCTLQKKNLALVVAN